MHRVILILLAVHTCITTGCSTVGGFSLWPSQFPLLTETKELASNSPLPASLPRENSKLALEDYFLEPGDRVLVEPVKINSDFRAVGDQKVQIDGSVDLGEFGRLRIAGSTVEQVELMIENHIVEMGANREQFNVQLLETNAAVVYVLGEVGSPGAYAIDGHEVVLDIILKAGGLTSKASPCDILLARPSDPCDCRVVLPICYREITQMGNVATNYQLQPGDRIIVGGRTLLEEIAIWKQTSSCQRCCQDECVECQPQNANYRNRFLTALNPFAKPIRSDDRSTQSTVEYPGTPGQKNSNDANSNALLIGPNNQNDAGTGNDSKAIAPDQEQESGRYLDQSDLPSIKAFRPIQGLPH